MLSHELSSEFFEKVFDTTLVATIVLDLESGAIVRVNPAACALYGYDCTEMEQLGVMDLSAEPEETRRALKLRETYVPLRVQRRKDGTTFPTEITASEFVVGVQGVRVAHIRDLTESLATQSRLAASEAKFSIAFRTSPDAVNINRATDGLFVEVNEGFTALTGYTAQDVEGRTSNEIALWADPSAREALAMALRSGAVRDFEADFRHKEGGVRRGLMSARMITVGDEPCILSVTRDISERVAAQAAQAALDASEPKFATAFRTSPYAINITRMTDGRYIDVNDGFLAMTGYTRQEVLDRTSIELEVWDDAADRDRMVTGLVDAGAVENLETLFRRKDGSTLVGLMSARVMDIDGEACVLTVTRDISEGKLAEEALRTSNARLEGMVRDVAEAMGRIVESRDPYTQGHQERVAELSRLIGAEMGLTASELDTLQMAALVHDVGKLAIPAEILNKPGALSSIEFSLINVHSEKGYEILKDIDFGAPIAEIVLQHHERMDGSGYPNGLLGNEIYAEARILFVADVVEAMASYRPYRPAVGLEPALAEISTKPEKYDADVVSACLILHARGELDFLWEKSQ